MNSYIITPQDFLYISQELAHVIELCTPTVIQSADPKLGFSRGISYTRRKLRGHILEQKTAIPTATGWIRAVTNLIACVSSLDFKISDLNSDVRIGYQGELFQVEHQKDYTHQGKSIYHELKLVNASKFSGNTVAQPDSNLDVIALPPASAPVIPIALISPEPDFDF